MSVAVVQAVGAVEDGVGGAKNVTIAATGAGNTLVVGAYSAGDTEISAPSAPSGSWEMGVNISNEPGSSKNMRIMWLQNISAGITTVTWTPVAGDNCFYVYELSGVGTSNVKDVISSGINGGSSTPTDALLTATNSGSGMIVMGCAGSSGDGWGAGSGFTNLLTGANLLSAAEAKMNISGGNTGAFTHNSVAFPWSILSVIFKPSGGGSFITTLDSTVLI